MWEAVVVVEVSAFDLFWIYRTKVGSTQTNRIQCFRLTERCATAIFSVRAEIADAERDTQSQPGALKDDGLAKEMERPVGKLNECVGMVRFSFALGGFAAFFVRFDNSWAAYRCTISS